MHGNWTPALEAARERQFTSSCRVTDYRHTFKAIEEGLKERLVQRGEDDEQRYLSECLRAVQHSRCHCTTLTEFSCFWHETLLKMEHE